MVYYLVSNGDAVTVEHDAAHECHSPLRCKGRQSAVLCLARISLASCINLKQFHSRYSSNNQRFFPVYSVPHCESKDKVLTGLKKCRMLARTEFYQFVFVQNHYPELLKHHSEAHPNVPCSMLLSSQCRRFNSEVMPLCQGVNTLLLSGAVICACEEFYINVLCCRTKVIRYLVCPQTECMVHFRSLILLSIVSGRPS